MLEQESKYFACVLGTLDHEAKFLSLLLRPLLLLLLFSVLSSLLSSPYPLEMVGPKISRLALRPRLIKRAVSGFASTSSCMKDSI